MATPSREEILALAQTDVRNAIPQETLLPILTTAPFIPTRSLVNIRDVGAVPGSSLPFQRIYRCGALNFAAHDPDAIAWLSNNVKKVFDLRRGPERAAAPDPEIPGVDNVWFDTEGEYPMPDLETFAVDGGAPAWGQQLLNVTVMYRGTIRALLEHVRDHPEEPFVFHCTAGRDRTGVVAGLLQTLAGTSPDDIVYDYLLSRIGTEAAREKLVKFAMGSLGIEDIETPGFVNVVDLRPEFWHAFVKVLGEKYGGVEGYVTQGLGFSEEDLGTIKKNLRA